MAFIVLRADGRVAYTIDSRQPVADGYTLVEADIDVREPLWYDGEAFHPTPVQPSASHSFKDGVWSITDPEVLKTNSLEMMRTVKNGRDQVPIELDGGKFSINDLARLQGFYLSGPPIISWCTANNTWLDLDHDDIGEVIKAIMQHLNSNVMKYNGAKTALQAAVTIEEIQRIVDEHNTA